MDISNPMSLFTVMIGGASSGFGPWSGSYEDKMVVLTAISRAESGGRHCQWR